jgi:hypothetical protein
MMVSRGDEAHFSSGNPALSGPLRVGSLPLTGCQASRRDRCGHQGDGMTRSPASMHAVAMRDKKLAPVFVAS